MAGRAARRRSTDPVLLRSIPSDDALAALLCTVVRSMGPSACDVSGWVSLALQCRGVAGQNLVFHVRLGWGTDMTWSWCFFVWEEVRKASASVKPRTSELSCDLRGLQRPVAIEAVGAAGHVWTSDAFRGGEKGGRDDRGCLFTRARKLTGS